jgi:hypothetical protein
MREVARHWLLMHPAVGYRRPLVPTTISCTIRPVAANDSIPLQVELIAAEDLHAFPHLLLDQLEMVHLRGADE